MLNLSFVIAIYLFLIPEIRMQEEGKRWDLNIAPPPLPIGNRAGLFFPTPNQAKKKKNKNPFQKICRQQLT